MITFESKGSYPKTERFLQKMSTGDIYKSLQKYAEIGRHALAEATPRDGGETSESWTVEVKKERGAWTIVWSNTNQEDGFPVAIMLQYGHATGTGGYVRGQDYINPAIKPIFDQISRSVWEEVTRA